MRHTTDVFGLSPPVTAVMWLIKLAILYHTIFTFIILGKILPAREIEAIVERLEKVDRQLCKQLIFPKYDDRYCFYDGLVEYRTDMELFLKQMRQDTMPTLLEPIIAVCKHHGPDFLQLYLDNCSLLDNSFRYVEGEQFDILTQVTKINNAWSRIRSKMCPTEDDKGVYEDDPLILTNATLEYGH